MEALFDCPICEQESWRSLARVRYRRGDRAAEPGGELNGYELLRRRVLFEVWFPGEEEVELTTLLCEVCGLAVYAPRPTESDLAAKYRFLAEHEPEIGGSDRTAAGARLDRRRAERTRAVIVAALAREPRRVLDFGGGDGKLLAPFLERGADCAVIDYNPRPLPGIAKLGDTLEDASPDPPFDAIVASHVLEHLARPAELLRALRAFLAPDGVLFSEVPLEIWKGVPIERDPVTHVNFFTPGSLLEAHARSGWRVAAVRSLRGSYGAARKPVAVAVARADGDAWIAPGRGLAEAERLLRPGLVRELARAWRDRRLPSVRGIGRRLGLRA